MPTLRTTPFYLLIVLIAIACKDPKPSRSKPEESKGISPCLIVVSGAVATQLNCKVLAAWQGSTGEGFMGVAGRGEDGWVVTLWSTLPGDVQPGNYTATKFKSFSCAVTQANGPVFFACTSNPKFGDLSMNITSVAAEAAIPTAKEYVIHGTADGKLSPMPGTPTTGAVSFHIIF